MAYLYKPIEEKISRGEYSERIDKCTYKGEKSNFEDSSSDDESRVRVISLFEAIEKGEELDEIKKLCKHRYIKASDELKNNCLHIAVNVKHYDLNVIKELLKRGADVNQNNWKEETPLHTAAENPDCDVDLIKVLLDGGADPNAKNVYKDTPLHLFVMKCLQETYNDRNLEIIQLLLKNGAQPNVRNSAHITPFFLAVHPPYCHLSAFVGLVKFGADFSVTRSNESLLEKPLIPSSSRSLDLVKIFLAYEPTLVNEKDIRSRTPLHIAVFGGAGVDVVKELISKGASVNDTDEQGNTPLHQLMFATYSVIETLVKYGADINAKNLRNRTPLIECLKPRLNIMNYTAITALIELGANIDLYDEFSDGLLDASKMRKGFPLCIAMLNDSVPIHIVNLLLKKGKKNTLVEFQDIYAEKYSYQNGPNEFNANKKPPYLYLQYYLFYAVLDKYIIDHSESLVSFYRFGHFLNETFSKFRDNCLFELLHMKFDWLNNETTLYSFIYRNIAIKHREYEFSESLIKEVLIRLNSNQYNNCKDLLRASLQRKDLIEYLSVLIIYTTKLDVPKQSIVLDLYSVKILAKFLDQDTLLNLVVAFIDHLPSKKRRLCKSPYCPNFYRHGVKSLEQNLFLH